MKALAPNLWNALLLVGVISLTLPPLQAASVGQPFALAIEQLVEGSWQQPSSHVISWGSSPQRNKIPDHLSGVIAIADGESYGVALRSEGSVVAWGIDSYGVTNVPTGLSGVVAIAAGSYHTVALKSDGKVITWGRPNYAENKVHEGLDGVVAIAGGMYHTLALKDDGSVAAWGYHAPDQTTIPSGLGGVVAIAAGVYHSMALKSDGGVVVWGYNGHGQCNVPDGLDNVVAIAAGGYHSVALKSDGSVVAWGYNGEGQCNVPDGLNGVVAIAAGSQHTLALKGDGSVVAWGMNFGGESTVPNDLPPANLIAAGSFNSVALICVIEVDNCPIGSHTDVSIRFTNRSPTQTLSDLRFELPSSKEGQFSMVRPSSVTLAPGQSVQATISYAPRTAEATSGQFQVYAAGSALPVAMTTLHVGKAAAAIFDSVGQSVSGASRSGVIGWGYNSNGRMSVPAGLSDVVGVTAAPYSTMALKGDGSVVAWGYNASGALNVPDGLNNVVAIAENDGLAVAVKSDGSVFSWGAIPAMMKVPSGLRSVVSVATGESHVVALKNDGRVATWGYNYEGQLNAPAGLSDVTGIAVGAYHTLALKGNGRVVAWGSKGYGQTKIPAGLKNVVAVAAGAFHSIALKEDGGLVAWGANDFGQADVPASLSGVVAIAAGQAHTVALTNEGTIVSWGYNYYGQNDVPAGLSGVFAIAAGGDHTVALVEALNDFPSVQLGSHRDHTLFLKDTGSVPLKIARVIIEGPEADEFSVPTYFPTPIAVGEQSAFILRFTPKRPGQATATLKIYSNDPGSPLVLPLTGTGNFSITATKTSIAGGAFKYAPLRPDSQTGLMLQKISFTNTTGVMLNGLRITLSKVASEVVVYSSSPGKTTGSLEVLFTSPIKPDETISFDLVYNDPQRRTADSINPVIRAEILGLSEPKPGPVTGALVPLRSLRDTAQGPLLEWNSARGQTFVVEYSNDNGATWFSAVHRLAGGVRILWVDRGQPETESKPQSKTARMYRVKRI